MSRFTGTLAALVVVAAGLLAPVAAEAVQPRAGDQFFGSTSQGGPVVARVSRDGQRVALTTLAVEMRCTGRDLVRPNKYEELYLAGFTLTQGGSFSRSGHIARFDSGPGGIGRFPVVASGDLRGGFRSPQRLVGSGRLTLTGKFYLGGGSGEGFASERATCRTGPFRFSAEAPRDTRARTGALTELPASRGCLFSRERRGCRLVPALGTPSEIILARDGRNAYVLTDLSEEIRVLHSLERNPRTGRLRLLEGPGACLTGSAVSGCSAIRGLGNLLHAVLSPDGRNIYLMGDAPSAVATFARDPSTGRLEQLPGELGCMGRTDDGCAQAPPFAGSPTAEVSPDGKHLYVSWLAPEVHSPDRGVLWLPRQRATGALSVTDAPPCLSSFGRHGCRRAPWRHPVEELVIPEDGRSVYGVLTRGQIAGMRRNSSTGALSPLPEPETCHFTGRARGCRVGGIDAAGLVPSPDGRTLYYAFDADIVSVVAVMARDPKTGFLEQLDGQAGCVGSEEAAGCRVSRGLDILSELAISPDGRNVYVGSFGDGLVSVFSRQRDGRLIQLAGSNGCLVGLHGHPAIVDLPYRCKRTLLGDEIDGMAISPDGRHFYVGSGTYPRVGGLHVFRRAR